jgi:hypothetical protein
MPLIRSIAPRWADAVVTKPADNRAVTISLLMILNTYPENLGNKLLINTGLPVYTKVNLILLRATSFELRAISFLASAVSSLQLRNQLFEYC